MKLAKFQDIGPYPMTLYYPDNLEAHTDMVRTSEYVEVEFPPRAKEEMVPAQVAIINQKIAEVTEEFGRKLAALKEVKDNLLALTFEREPEVVE